jgi:hypothetical protein
MYVAMTGDSGSLSHRNACVLMRLFVVGNCVLVFVVQIVVRLVEGLICVIAVPHIVVIFVGCSGLIQCHILIGRMLIRFRKGCCFHRT